MSSVTPETLIEKFDLKPHPEGGFAQLLYEDPWILQQEVLPCGYNGSRSLWNGIYFLIPEGSRSIFHRIAMNELWNFYLGGPLELYQISPEGELSVVILGSDILNGEHLTHIFPKGCWIGAKPSKGSKFAFVSCITAPGFTFHDWERGVKGDLLRMHPHLTDVIQLLTD